MNWIVLMGWGVAEDDIMTLDQMVERFDLEHLNPSPAAINFAKLDHFNGTHIRLLSTEDLAARMNPFLVPAGYEVDYDRLTRIVPLIRERLVTLDDCVSFAGWFFKDTVTPKPEELIGKNLTPSQSADIARKSYQVLSGLPELSHALAEPPMRKLVEDSGMSPNQVFGILRVAVTGQTISPPLFESMEIVGKELVLKRIQDAILVLEKIK